MKELDSSKVVNWTQDLNFRREAIDFLAGELKRGQLNENQIKNGVLFKISAEGFREEILDLFVNLTNSRDSKVRAEAVYFAIAVVTLADRAKLPIRLSEPQIGLLRRSIQLGLKREDEDRLKEFLSPYPPGNPGPV